MSAAPSKTIPQASSCDRSGVGTPQQGPRPLRERRQGGGDEAADVDAGRVPHHVDLPVQREAVVHAARVRPTKKQQRRRGGQQQPVTDRRAVPGPPEDNSPCPNQDRQQRQALVVKDRVSEEPDESGRPGPAWPPRPHQPVRHAAGGARAAQARAGGCLYCASGVSVDDVVLAGKIWVHVLVPHYGHNMSAHRD